MNQTKEVRVNADVCEFLGAYYCASIMAEGAGHRGMGIVTLRKKKDGPLYVNDRKTFLYLADKQKKENGGMITGSMLERDLAKKPTANLAIRETLLKNPELIPADWGYAGPIYFWATKFNTPGLGVNIGFMQCLGGIWHGGTKAVHSHFTEFEPAMMLEGEL